MFWQILTTAVSRTVSLRILATKEALILLIYMSASAMTLNIFMQTRSFEEGSTEFGFAAMMDGSASRPYVYRQLLPIIANSAVELVPEQERSAFVKYHLDKYHLKQQYFGRAKFQNNGTEEWSPRYAIMYHIIFAANFISLLGLTYLLRHLIQENTGVDGLLSAIAPVGFLALLPLSFMHGNFYYDFPELFFLAALLVTATTSRFYWWVLLLPLAVINKESNILVPLLYLPVIYYQARRSLNAISSIGLAFILALAAYLFIKTSYAENPGGDTIWQLWKNVEFWLSPGNYFLWNDFYVPGIPFPRGLNILLILIITSLTVTAWKNLTPQIKALFLMSLIVNLPLWLLFCHQDEMRNLSFTFLPIFLITTMASMELFGQPTQK